MKFSSNNPTKKQEVIYMRVDDHQRQNLTYVKYLSGTLINQNLVYTKPTIRS